MAKKKKLYSFDDHPKHRARLAEWRDRWIANAMSTKPMDYADRDEMMKAVRGLYEAAGLRPPPDHRIVFVPSPLVALFAGGFAAWDWHRRGRGGKKSATAAATRDATDAATRAATRDATSEATSTRRSGGSWYAYDGDMASVARLFDPGHVDQMLKCAESAYEMWNGGNQWSAWVSYLSFFREVAKLDIDYSKFIHYEKAAIHGGPRVMHREFCIVSDRPRTLKVDEQNRPHCEDGPFCEWSDGFRLYSIHGVRVPQWVVERPSEITAEKCDAEGNAEVRRIMIERIGVGKYLSESGAKLVDMDSLTLVGSAPRALVEDKRGEKWLVGTDGSTKRVYFMPVDPASKTCKEAHESICGFSEDLLIAEC